MSNMEKRENIRMLITFIKNEWGDNKEYLMKTAEDLIDNKIPEVYDLRSDCFIFEKLNRSGDIFITFKASILDENQEHLENTKFINWKPRTNTFYTINALNYLVLGECGELNRDHQINWNNHRNKLIMLKKSFNDKKVLSEVDFSMIKRIGFSDDQE